MKGIFLALESLGLKPVLLAYAAILVAHELEEWNIAAFERRHFEGLPACHGDESARGVIFLVSALALAFGLGALLAPSESAAALVFFPLAAFSATNSAQHLYWATRFRAYAPGLVSAAFLLPGTFLISAWALSRGSLPAWYLGFLALLSSGALVATLVDGRRMPKAVQVAYALGARIASLLGPRGKA